MLLLATYLAALVVMLALDALWLGFAARDFYQREMAGLMLPQVNKLPAALFYLGYPAGLVLLALSPRPEHLGLAIARSALVGLVAYGAYDLTNLATLRGWSTRLALVDLIWGVTVSAAAGAAAWLVAERLR